ncbi:MAG: TPM domain-containing protein [Casimicrobiaceae bacterium]
MNWQRLWAHLFTDHRSAQRLFPAKALHRLELATKHGEQVHNGQVRLAIEPSLPLGAVRHNVSARARAIEVFAMLRVWDTGENCGVLVYLLVADRAVEIVADRGIDAKVDAATWAAICAKMEDRFRAGDFAGGAQFGLVEIGALLATHFPRRSGDPRERANELSDAPVML